jgi:hypothetical protein
MRVRRAAAVSLSTALSVLAVGLTGCASANHAQRDANLYTFELTGGFFYGPGPVVPDTPLPNGKIQRIHFDLARFRGYAEFHNDGRRSARLSDGLSQINQNIDAGRLLIGGGSSPILLTAVNGGPHKGTETYTLDADYRLVWHVDLALDPGFEEGIIRINDFVLHTGVVRVARSIQATRHIPGGYDQAGTLTSGRYLVGRLGDFDQDGYLDGILVAGPNVPMDADLLPGSPVGNRRGFKTNIPLPANVSAELILRSMRQLLQPLRETAADQDIGQFHLLAAEYCERIETVDENLVRAIGAGAYQDDAVRPQAAAVKEQLGRARSSCSADMSVGELQNLAVQIATSADALGSLNRQVGGLQLPSAALLASS